MTKKIKITISRPRVEKSVAAKIIPYREKGIIRRDVRAEYLPRRKKSRKGIRIFDLARSASGAEINFRINASLDFPTWGTPIEYAQPGSSDYATRDTFLFNLAENFEDYFYEIKQSDGDFYRIILVESETEGEILTTDSESWLSSGGFKKPESLLALSLDSNENGGVQKSRQNMFAAIDTEPAFSKITGVYDFAADAVNFAFRDGDSIFWMPAIPTHRVVSHYQTGSNYFERLLGNQFRFSPRQFYIDHGVEPENFEPAQEFVSVGESAEAYERTYGAAHFHESLYLQRCYQRYENLGNGQTVWSIVDADVLPEPPFSSSEPPDSDFFIESEIINFGSYFGSLVAIVKRGNNLFYIWNIL